MHHQLCDAKHEQHLGGANLLNGDAKPKDLERVPDWEKKKKEFSRNI